MVIPWIGLVLLAVSPSAHCPQQMAQAQYAENMVFIP
jgi:hypothetical protein